ncbi:MAG: PAS domain S-box protein [Haloferacaceae archaeon]
MTAEGSRSPGVVAVGDETTRATLSEPEAGLSPVLEAEVVEPDAVDAAAVARWNADCVLVDGEVVGDGVVDLVERCVDERPELPVVVLVGEGQQLSVDALAAGATDTLPRRLPESDAGLFVDRLEHGIEVAGRRREDTRKELFESVADGLVVHHPDTGEIQDVNGRYCEITGYSREELVGEDVGTVLPDDKEVYDDAVARIRRAREEGPQLFEFEGERRDGETFVGEIHLTVVTLDGRERVIASVRDVTDRKRQERAVRALGDATERMQDADTSEELAETAVDAVADALEHPVAVCWWHDPDEERLVPAAATEEGREEDLVSPLEADRYEYEVFQAGTVAQYVPRDEGEENPPETGILLPLGDHGLIAAGRHEDVERDDVMLDVVRTLAEHTITALDRIERATEVRESERRFRMLMDRIDQVVYLGRTDLSEVIYINPAYEKIWGRERKKLYEDPESFLESIDPRDREGFLERWGVMRDDIDGGDPDERYDFQFRIRRPDGEIRWIDDTVYPLELPNGEGRLVGFADDVTERKRREREYEQIFNGVNDIINVYDPETGDLLDVNDTMSELTGYDRETLLEGGLEAVSVAEEGFTGRRAREITTDVMESGESRELEWQLESADGERIWLDVKATPATINGEKRLLTISRDVTDRRRTERRLRAILDRIDEAIFFARAHELDEPSPAPDFVSSGYEDIWGLPLDEMHDRYEEGFFGTLHPDHEGEYRALIDEILRDIDGGTADDRYSIEYRIERPDGDVRWVHSDYYPVYWGEEPVRLAVVSRDVTDRKARERRMASFDEATDDLTAADTREQATRMAVETAVETLDLPAVGAFLYDDDDGVLRPEALAGSVSNETTPDAIGPGDGPLWEAFATGRIADPAGELVAGESDGEPAGERRDPAGLGEWRAIPLGNHGLLLAGAPDGSLGSDAIQSTHVLAATLEATLNYHRGQERLAAREEQLRTQTRRADRLDRIARLAQQVEAAITEASAPAEVERAVCERLADSGPYELAWIGAVDVGVDRVSPSTVVGESKRYVEDLPLTTTEGGDAHPAVRAWRTSEVRVTDSIVADGPAGDWRRHALSEGYQSLCAVPLTHDGLTYGVLAVGAGEPNAFGDRERELLEQLGTSIGNALAAIERRRALESDETVELEFSGAAVDLSFARAAREAGCQVHHERTVTGQGGTVSVFFRFEGDVPDVVAPVAKRELPGEVTVVTRDPSELLVEARTDDWFGSPLAEYGAVLRDAFATPEETTISVEVSAQADVRSFVDRLREMAPSLDLAAKRQHRSRELTPAETSDRLEEELTSRQHEVIRTALSAGYFEWPRENDGSEVAERLGITQPTLNKHLRLAERKTFELLFEPGT